MRALTPKRILTNPFFSVKYFTLFCYINHATIVLQGLWRFAIIRELPSPLMFAFIRDLVGLGRFYIK